MRQKKTPTFIFLLIIATVFCSTSLLFAQEKKLVTIYTASWCSYCRSLKLFLNENKISYTEYDIERDLKGREEFKRLSGRSVPLIKINRKVIHGLQKEQILKELGR